MIPVLTAYGDCIARAWENSLIILYNSGCSIKTEYDKPNDPPSKDATMIITVHKPLAEPMIHKDLPCGYETLQEYVMEILEGTKDHLIRDPNDPNDTRWEYTYHQRLFNYDDFDQIENIINRLSKTPYSRRVQAITWKVKEDNDCYDPACLQSIWCRIIDNQLNMNVRFRSNDAYKAAMMNIYALIRLQEYITNQLSIRLKTNIQLGRYCHIADSYHIYGKDLREFEDRFLGAVQKRTFEERTIHYEDVKDIMENPL